MQSSLMVPSVYLQLPGLQQAAVLHPGVAVAVVPDDVLAPTQNDMEDIEMNDRFEDNFAMDSHIFDLPVKGPF